MKPHTNPVELDALQMLHSIVWLAHRWPGQAAREPQLGDLELFKFSLSNSIKHTAIRKVHLS
jgi:hypothetical protein